MKRLLFLIISLVFAVSFTLSACSDPDRKSELREFLSSNEDAYSVIDNLSPFKEAVWNEDGSDVVFIRSVGVFLYPVSSPDGEKEKSTAARGALPRS